MTHYKRHHLPWFVCPILIAALCGPAFAVTLNWVGDVSNNWFDGTAGVDTNWSGDALPTAGDDLVFLGPSSGAAYGGALNLGGNTIAANSITVGAPGDTAPGQSSDFAPLVSPPTTYTQTLATNGTIQLGAGGLTMHMAAGPGTVYNAPDGTYRNIRFETDFELTDSTAFFKSVLPSSTTPNAKWKTRQLQFGGQIRNASGVSSVDLESICPDGGSGTMFAFVFEQGLADFAGTLSLSGAQDFRQQNLMWGDPSTVVKLSTGGPTNVYAFKSHPGNAVVYNDIEFDPSVFVRLYCTGGSSSTWEFAGDITGGSSGYLDLLGAPNTRFIFSGDEQSFTNWLFVRTGTGVIIAGGADGSGLVLPNAGYIRMNGSRLTSGTSALLLRGDYTLNQLVQVWNQSFTSWVVPVEIGQTNDGSTAFDAIFNGRIDVQEPDFQVLRLTADAGGSATFNGEINVNGGGYGFDKIGAGTVVLNGRVSEDLGNTTPIGTVNVDEGTLLVNNSFYTTGIVVNEGAALGGSGDIFGNVTLAGTAVATLAPGASIGTITVDGDVDFASAGVLAIEIDGNSVDRLDVTGLLDLSAGDDTLALSLTGPTPNSTLVIASYGSLLGVFDNVDLSVLPSCYRLDYNFAGQNQIALVVPEPAGVALLLCGALALLLRRKRRARR